MPPLSIPEGYSRMSNSANSTSYGQLPKIFLLVLVVATAIRLTVLCCTRKKIRTLDPCQPLFEKTGLKSCEPEEENEDSTLCQAPLGKITRPDDYLQSNDNAARTSRPIYPWISSPQQLPGPYDPRFYPLPTLRRLSCDPSHGPLPENESDTISYTCRVSTDSLFHGTVTTVSNGNMGWRRNQWVISG